MTKYRIPEQLLTERDIEEMLDECFGRELTEHLMERIRTVKQEDAYAEKRFNSDLIFYEQEVEEWGRRASDVQDVLNEMNNCIEHDKRLDRHVLANQTHRIENILRGKY